MKLPILFCLMVVIACAQERQQKSDATQAAAAAPTLEERATAIHAKSIVIDTHIDIPNRIDEDGVDISKRLPDGHFDFIRAKEGGLDASFFAVYVASRFNLPGTGPNAAGGAYAESQRIIKMINDIVAKHPDLAELAFTPDDVRRIAASGKHAVIMGMENGAPIERDLNKLRQLYQQGIRYITLTHSADNHISDSSYDNRHTHKGLSEFGKEVVREMNRLGVMIDVSHISDDAFWQVMQLTQSPVIASHSSLRRFRHMERNMSDPMLLALKKNGGVIQINFGSFFLSDDYQSAIDGRDRQIETIKKKHAGNEASAQSEINEFKRKHPVKNVTLADVIKHIDYAVKLIGVDHVGLGSDFDGVSRVPDGLDDVSNYPKITLELLKLGYSEEDIMKINGENLLRVWEQNIQRSVATQGE